MDLSGVAVQDIQIAKADCQALENTRNALTIEETHK